MAVSEHQTIRRSARRPAPAWLYSLAVLTILILGVIIFATVLGPRATTEKGPVSQRAIRDESSSLEAYPPDLLAADPSPPFSWSVKGSDVLGARATDGQGAEIATVEDILLDMTTGAAGFAALSTDSQAPWTLLPIEELVAKADGGIVVHSATTERLAIARRVTPRELARSTTNSNGRVVRATALIGAHLLNTAGDSLGVIEDVVLETRPWRQRYAVVRGNEGEDARYFAVPLEDLVPTGKGAEPAWTVSVERSSILTLSHFATWPDINDTASVRRIERRWDQVFPSRSATESTNVPGDEQSRGKGERRSRLLKRGPVA
jgi:sporulation protein YlmC with PRC-barrel domain